MPGYSPPGHRRVHAPARMSAPGGITKTILATAHSIGTGQFAAALSTEAKQLVPDAEHARLAVIASDDVYRHVVRQLATAEPDRHQPNLATSLRNLTLIVRDGGVWDRSLRIEREAVTV
jgi:hypothetical protein